MYTINHLQYILYINEVTNPFFIAQEVNRFLAITNDNSVTHWLYIHYLNDQLLKKSEWDDEYFIYRSMIDIFNFFKILFAKCSLKIKMGNISSFINLLIKCPVNNSKLLDLVNYYYIYSTLVLHFNRLLNIYFDVHICRN